MGRRKEPPALAALAGPRDPAMYDNPDMRRPRLDHAARLDEHGLNPVAWCSGAVIDTARGVAAAEVRERHRCTRRGCRERWPAPPEPDPARPCVECNRCRACQCSDEHAAHWAVLRGTGATRSVIVALCWTCRAQRVVDRGDSAPLDGAAELAS